MAQGHPRDTNGTRASQPAGLRRLHRHRGQWKLRNGQALAGRVSRRLAEQGCPQCPGGNSILDSISVAKVAAYTRSMTAPGPIGGPRMSLGHANTLVMSGRPPAELPDPKIIGTKKRK